VDRALARRLRAWAGERPLLCTEKDRVRLPPDVADAVWWRPRSIRIDDPPTRWIDLG
jgi:tetraacyldisaccharide-1-P 4'-kinase